MTIWRLTSPLAHTPLRQLADFLQRGRGDGLTINIPPAPFKGGDVTVSRMGKGDGQQEGKMGWSAGWGDMTVSRMGRWDGQWDGER
ncbi:hypothetical protein HMPREF9074_08877 [Capnocytophaga sp. oral taxon 329 str. F0087]|nr:hypothetical protein HMPREF9074_08877 [Capnocytophaga sp. oral taxon 329 str. F0087]